MGWCVATFYHFVRLNHLAEKQGGLRHLCANSGIKGTILLGAEGINGTISGTDTAIASVIAHIEEWDGIDTLEVKYSTAEAPSFLRLKVKIKDEIVTMGKPDINPAIDTGTHIAAKDWNRLITRPDIMVIDTRNHYETRIGGFAGAIDPKTDSFRAFPDWADSLAAESNRPKAVALYCTGGIRCEKAAAYMKKLGFGEVYHLKGGILKYLETVAETDSLWHGECFVFDGRVALRHNLEEGEYGLCHACREPITDADKRHPLFEKGVACPYCAGRTSQAQQARFRQRQCQIDLAELRGEQHLGGSRATPSRRSAPSNGGATGTAPSRNIKAKGVTS